ncbi:MAG: ABC transporter permease subunit [Armatimonadetes bacterium]|nr:ABC transporter permease subunit [Armatimonadota bacterium]
MIIWAIARTTVGDALRKKILQVFIVVAIGLIVLSLSFSQTLSFSSQRGASSDFMLLKSFGLGMMALAGIFISLILGVTLIPQEFERRTIYTILAKPVKRYEFITGKFLGAILTLGIATGLMGITFILTIVIKAIGAQQLSASPTLGQMLGSTTEKVAIFDWNMVWGVILVYLQFMVLSSIVLLFSLIFTQTVNFFMGAAVYAVGFMSTVVISLGGAEGANVALQLFYKTISYVLPRFDQFNIPNQLLHPETQVTNMGAYTGMMALYGLLYTLLALVAAILIFERKEV